jgi:hypothetical protein
MQELKNLSPEEVERIRKAARVPSTIQFPYTDMSDAIAVAEGVLRGGGIALTRDQLAAAMGLAPNGGGFATKVATAKTFGVVEAQAGKYQLTELGHEVVDPQRRPAAMSDSFLAVELYRKVYEEFRGKRLPPRPHGLEAAFVNFGVSPKNAKIARLAFDKSARMAGFFPNGDEDRLVMPFAIDLRKGPAEEGTRAGDDPQVVNLDRAALPSPRPTESTKSLEYLLIDLLGLNGVGEPEAAAIWTLVRFLKKKRREAPSDFDELLG